MKIGGFGHYVKDVVLPHRFRVQPAFLLTFVFLQEIADHTLATVVQHAPHHNSGLKWKGWVVC
jgi:hypothetical protein